MKLSANGIPRCVPFDDKNSVFEEYFHARNNPVASMNA